MLLITLYNGVCKGSRSFGQILYTKATASLKYHYVSGVLDINDRVHAIALRLLYKYIQIKQKPLCNDMNDIISLFVMIGHAR